MKIYYGFLLCVWCVTGSISHTQPVCYPDDIYVTQLYNSLHEYVTTGSGITPDNVNDYVKNNSTVQGILSQGEDAGYSSRSIVKKTYQYAMQRDPVDMTVVEGIRINLRQYYIFKRIVFWDTLACSTFASLGTLVSIWFYTLYFRKDRRAIKHYIATGLGGFQPHPHSSSGW